LPVIRPRPSATAKKGIAARKSSLCIHTRPCQAAFVSRLFLFPDLLHSRGHLILCILPHSPPVSLIDTLQTRLQCSVPPVLRHLRQPGGLYPRYRHRRRRFWLDDALEDGLLLAQECGLCDAVPRVERYGEVEDRGGEGEAPELCIASVMIPARQRCEGTYEAGCEAHGGRGRACRKVV
jgi:hypothetical protein